MWNKVKIFDKVTHMIEIDGGYREGGGQILRTSLSLACLFRKPFRMFNIRKGRKKPGLMPQHLTAVRAAQLLAGAEVKGDAIGSSELSFFPGEIKSGNFFFDIGTAGATSLVLQTLIPAISLQTVIADSSAEKGDAFGGETSVKLRGGTHVPFSPSFHYLARIFTPFLAKIGINIQLSIESYGFYPKGGGVVRAEIFPAKKIRPLRVPERGNILKLEGCSAVGGLPMSIAERQRETLLDKLSAGMREPPRTVEIDIENVPTQGQGTFLFLLAESENSIAGFTSLGERGKRAETVGEEAAAGFLEYFATGASIDSHMSDQIVLYLSACTEESEFTTSGITEHLLTNLWAINLFHEYRYTVEGEVGQAGRIRINYP